MHPVSPIATQLAVLFIAASGVLIVFRRRLVAFRFFLAGVVIASASAIIATQVQLGSYAGRLEEIVAWLGVTGVIAAVFGARRLAAYFITPAAILWLMSPLVLPVLQPVMTWLARNWWVVPVILIAPLIAMLTTAGWQKSLRSYARGPRASRFVGRILDQMFNGRKIRRRPDRHIGNSARSTFRKGDQRRG